VSRGRRSPIQTKVNHAGSAPRRHSTTIGTLGRRAWPRTVWAVGVVLLFLLVAATLPSAVAAGYPPLPEALFGSFVGNLTVPTLAAGATGPLTFTLGNPLGQTISEVNLTLGFYEFNAYPGNATGPIPPGSSPSLVTSNASAPVVTVPFAPISPREVLHVALQAVVPPGAPDGLYAIRTALAFNESGQVYRLESRGHFTDQQWANATSASGGYSTLNVSRLGVSGVLPETAVIVRSTTPSIVLPVLIAASVLFAGIGGYIAWRKGPGSKSGAVPEESHKARTAFGKRRNKEGD